MEGANVIVDGQLRAVTDNLGYYRLDQVLSPIKLFAITYVVRTTYFHHNAVNNSISMCRTVLFFLKVNTCWVICFLFTQVRCGISMQNATFI